MRLEAAEVGSERVDHGSLCFFIKLKSRPSPQKGVPADKISKLAARGSYCLGTFTRLIISSKPRRSSVAKKAGE